MVNCPVLSAVKNAKGANAYSGKNTGSLFLYTV